LKSIPVLLKNTVSGKEETRQYGKEEEEYRYDPMLG
jgi:hypothetical protein